MEDPRCLGEGTQLRIGVKAYTLVQLGAGGQLSLSLSFCMSVCVCEALRVAYAYSS